MTWRIAPTAAVAAWLVAATAAAAIPVAAREGPVQDRPPEAVTTDPDVTVPITAGDLARIRKALENSPAIKIDDNQLKFYVRFSPGRRVSPTT